MGRHSTRYPAEVRERAVSEAVTPGGEEAETRVCGSFAAAMDTLIGTAKLNDVDPQAWLAEILTSRTDRGSGMVVVSRNSWIRDPIRWNRRERPA